MVWDYEGTHPKTLYGEITVNHVGNDAAEAVNRFVSAYGELATQKFGSAKELQSHFLMGGIPMFSDKQAKSIFDKVQKKGGSTESAVSDGITSIIDIVSGKAAMGPPNPAIQAAMQSVQQVIRLILPFVFILNTFERSPMFGELLGAALDVTAATLPVIASAVQANTPALIGLIPIPFAGTVGIALGWLFSLFFLWLAMVIGVSRKDFASALEATAGMIPVIGGTAMRTVAASDRVLTKLSNRAEKIQAAIEQAYGSLKGALEQVTNKPEFQNASNFLKNMPITKMANEKLNSTSLTGNITSSPSFQAAQSFARPRLGGKRLTRRKKYKNKWRRTRYRSRKH